MFNLEILTPNKTVYKGKSDYLFLDTDDGEQVILPGHAPYMCRIDIGEMRYKDEGGEMHPLAVASGFLQVKGDTVFVLLDDAQYPDAIDIQQAEEAKKNAEELMKQAQNRADIAKLRAMIKLANLRIQTAKRYRKTQPVSG